MDLEVRMIKKTAIIIWVSVLVVALMEVFFPIKAHAQEAAEKAKTEVVFSTALRKAYVGLQGGVYHDDMVQQGDITVTLPSGVFFSAWGSTDFTKEKNFGKELDLIVGVSMDVGAVNVTLDQQYFMLQGSDALNSNLGLDVKGIFVRGELYFPATMTDQIQDGWAVAGGFAKDFSVGRLSLSIMEGVRYDSGAFGYEKAWVHRGYVGISLQMNEKTSFMVGVGLSQPITAVTDRKREVVWEIGLSHRLK